MGSPRPSGRVRTPHEQGVKYATDIFAISDGTKMNTYLLIKHVIDEGLQYE